MTCLNCDNLEMFKGNCGNRIDFLLVWPDSRSIAVDLGCDRGVTIGETQPLTESSAAAIGHSKQRRG
jgi:hypothetical protein